MLISWIFLISTLTISVANEPAFASEQFSQEKVSDFEQCNPDEELCNENDVNQSAATRQASGDDEGRPNDSIKAEGRDQVHQQEQEHETENKNTPDPLKINETAVQVSIYFEYLTFHKSHDLGSNLGRLSNHHFFPEDHEFDLDGPKTSISIQNLQTNWMLRYS